MTESTKSPARTYGESILPKVAAKYMARRMAESLTTNGVTPEDIGTVSHAQKVVTLDMAGLMFLRTLFDSDFPYAKNVLAACMPPLFDDGKYDDCIKTGEAGEAARSSIRHTLTVSCALLHEMLGVYVHELSHRTAGEHYGAKGEIAVMVFPEIKLLGEDGYGIALNVQGGRCRFIDAELTPEQQAVINVAGYMGEKLCATLKDDVPNAPSQDTDYWADVFKAIVEAGDPEKAEGEDANNPVFHSGSYQDATNFYTNAPDEDARLIAIEEASAIIVGKYNEILAEAAMRTIKHLTTLGECFGLMSVAMSMAEAASVGKYGEVRVVEVDK